MFQLSLIVSVLESYEVVRRQLLRFEQILLPGCELLMIDDGSEPPLRQTCAARTKAFPFSLHQTHDRRPWTQPKARNLGARLARADRLLFFDIDHILTPELIRLCLTYSGDKLHWLRRPAVLDEQGRVVTDRSVLQSHGLTDESPSVHANSFLIRKALFDRLGGYDERFCGRYGGDDADFNARYAQLCRDGDARPEEVRGEGFVYPDPARDQRRLFHSLRDRRRTG